MPTIQLGIHVPSSRGIYIFLPGIFTRAVTALMTELVETKPYSFEEVVEKLVWDDAMVEEYDSIVRNSVGEVVPRLEGKPVVGSR